MDSGHSLMKEAGFDVAISIESGESNPKPYAFTKLATRDPLTNVIFILSMPYSSHTKTC